MRFKDKEALIDYCRCLLLKPKQRWEVKHQIFDLQNGIGEQDDISQRILLSWFAVPENGDIIWQSTGIVWNQVNPYEYLDSPLPTHIKPVGT